jgi:photosystem II stability/assembly factor-like uncharacterized protein
MTVDPLDRLRSIDPAPDGSSAPPLEQVLAQIDASGAAPRRRAARRPPLRRWAGIAVPALGAAAAIAVVAVVVGLVIVHHRHAPAPAVMPATAPLQAVPTPGSLAPRGGMRGALLILGATTSSEDTTLISFGQCQPCYAGGQGNGSVTRDWLAATTDGGASWHVAQTPWNLDGFASAGADAWAEGLQSRGHGDGGYNEFYASHDGGRSWSVVSSAAPAEGGVGDVSIAAGEVWSLGAGCVGSRCTDAPPTDAILHAPASGSHLAATTAQPPLGDDTNVSVVATARDTAFVLADDYGTNPRVATIVRSRMFATSDGGRSWRSIATPCPGKQNFGRLYGGSSGLWATCSGLHGTNELRRPAGAGRTWVTVVPAGNITQFQPVSSTVAWVLTPRGRVLRTTDGGSTWTRVWYGGPPEPVVLAGRTPVLAAQNASTATVVAVVTHGRVDGHAQFTNFVVYRTTDGGRTWRPSVVRLPAG